MAAGTRGGRDDGHAVEERHQLHMASVQLVGHGQHRDRGQVQAQSEYSPTCPYHGRSASLRCFDGRCPRIRRHSVYPGRRLSPESRLVLCWTSLRRFVALLPRGPRVAVERVRKKSRLSFG